MRIKFFVILICLLSIIHGISYAQENDSTKNKNISLPQRDDRAMRELFQYDNRVAEAKSLLEKQQEYFAGISNYFEKDGNIKSIYITSTGEAITYTGQISEKDYEQLRNNLAHISMDSDFFEWGIKADYWRDIINNKMEVAIYDAILIKESDGFWCSEYFIYGKDDLPEKEANSPNNSTWQSEERINSNWYFRQNIQKISYRDNNFINWGHKTKDEKENEWAKESDLLSFKRVRKFITKHRKEFNEFAKILNEKDKHFNYYHYLDYIYEADGKQYKNFNEFVLQNREPIKNLIYENPGDKRCVLYCKRVENFIRLLEEHNLVLSAGISVDCEDLGDVKSSLKIFTRTKAQDDQCLNVTITYDETGLIRERDKSIKELMPGWYYKSEIGKIQGLNAAK